MPRIAIYALALAVCLVVAEPLTAVDFRRGDSNLDGFVDAGDGVYSLGVLFLGLDLGVFPCEAAADADADGEILITDVVYTFQWLFQGGSVLPDPGPFTCGPPPDIEPDELTCESYPDEFCPDPPSRIIDPRLELGFSGPSSIQGVPGTTVPFEVSVVLENSVEVTSWSISLSAIGCEVKGVALGSTLVCIGEPDITFHDEDVAQGEPGAVAGLVLNPLTSTVLPRSGEGVDCPGPHELLTLSMEVRIPDDGCATCSLAFRDGLSAGGQPQSNRFTMAEDPRRVVRSFETPFHITAGSGVSELQELSFGASETVRFERCDRGALFRVTPPASGAAVVVSFDGEDDDDAHALYARWGEAPAETGFDVAADLRFRSDQRLVLPATRNEDLFILVQAVRITGEPEGGSLRVELDELALASLSASRAAATGDGRLTASIIGAGFDAGTSFALEKGAGVVPAVERTIVSSRRAEVVFDLTAAAATAGFYDLTATEAGGVGAVLPQAFQVLDSSRGAGLEAELYGLEKYRCGRTSSLFLRYRNAGDHEMGAPIFKVTGPADIELGLSGGEFAGNELLVLGVHAGGVAGRLPPGGAGEIPIALRWTGCQDPLQDGPLELRLLSLSPLDDDFIRWDELEAPPGVSASDWAKAWPRLALDLGRRWAKYGERVADLATRLAHRGTDVRSVARIFQFALGRALGDPPAAIVGQIVDDATGKPLEGVSVLARQVNTTRSVALSDSGGYFALVGLRQDASYQLAAVDHAILSVAPGGIDVGVPAEGDVLGLVVRASAEANALSALCSACRDRDGPAVDASPEHYAERMAWSMEVFRSADPNEKDGPVGEGEDDDLIAVDEPILYRAYFANDRGAGANAPAQSVTLIDRLVSHLDSSTVEFKEVQVGGDSLSQRLYFGTPGPSSSPSDPVSSATGSSVSGTNSFDELMSIYQETDAGPTSYLIRIQGAASGGVLVVKFLPESPSLEDLEADEGFLPSLTDLQQNEGYVSFTIRPDSSLVLLSEPELPSIENKIDIQFDDNPEEPTRTIEHQLSHLLPLDLQGPVPSHEAAGVSPDTALQWFDRLADSHDIYLSTDPGLTVAPVSVVERFYQPPGGLAEGVTYYWKVIAQNDRGPLEGPTWSFTTALRADCATVPGSDPTPIPNAVEVRKDQTFAWPAFPGASSYDLYVWPSDSQRPEDPDVGGLGNPEYLGKLPTPLDTDTTYNWQVTASNPACDVNGPTWTFRTIDPGYQIPGDFTQDRVIDQSDAIALLGRLFNGDPASAPCGNGSTSDPANFALLNWNGDGLIDQTDAIALLVDKFVGGGGWHVLGRECIHILGCPDVCDP